MIKLGVIGLGGRMCGVVNQCLKTTAPELKVVGVVDPDEDGVRQRLAEDDAKDVVFCNDLADLIKRTKPDALAIGTRCHQHTPYAIEAAAYDLPLYLEKPVAINLEQATALEEAFRDSRCEVVVSFPLRLSPLCMLAKEFLDRQAVGNPVHICATNYVNYGTVYWEQEYRNFAITQGLFLQKATHDLDYMMMLMDSPIVRVGAMATYQHVFGGSKSAGLFCSKCAETDACLESPGNRRRAFSGHTDDHPCLFSSDCGTLETGTNEDCSSAVVEFASGAHGIYTQVFFTRRDAARRGAVISGYGGTLEFDWYSNNLKHTRHHAPFSDTVEAGKGLSHFGGDTELALDFINLIRGKAHSRTGITKGLQSVYTCLAAKQSAETGQFVDVRQVQS